MNKISDAIQAYKDATRYMKEATIAFINSIEELPVKRIGGETSSCFAVSTTTISNNGGILSPFYYDVKKQKEDLIEIVVNSKDIGFLKTLEEIADNGKRTIKNGGISFQQVYAPTVVSALKDFFKEENANVE